MGAEMKMIFSLALTAQYEARRLLGAPGAAGIALLIAATLLAGYAAPAWETHAAVLQRANQRIDQELKASGPTHDSPLSPAEQIHRFHAWFPPSSNAVDDLRLLGEQARSHKLALDKGEYQMVRESGKALLAYDIVLPVNATYPALRGFVSAVLNAAPHAALAELRMERPNAGNATLAARIHFRFTYQDE